MVQGDSPQFFVENVPLVWGRFLCRPFRQLRFIRFFKHFFHMLLQKSTGMIEGDGASPRFGKKFMKISPKASKDRERNVRYIKRRFIA